AVNVSIIIVSIEAIPIGMYTTNSGEITSVSPRVRLCFMPNVAAAKSQSILTNILCIAVSTASGSRSNLLTLL
ncbi:MAG: hypothetical protein II308_08085, partial [Muribaculaceae bacterium]|nr:hypothetical protein [Muribaculaceae bacterium]